MGTLAAGAHASGFNGQDAYQNKLVVIDAVVYESETCKGHGRFRDMEAGGVSPTLNAMDNNGEAYATVITAEVSGVRRLTPLECERLQGFPDNWTDGQADSNRYKQTGNAVAVPVVEWIINRLVQVDEKNLAHTAFCTELQVMYGETCICGVRQ